MAAPSDVEKGLIEKFREELKGVLDEERLSQDHYLLRWIRAREHNLPKAKDMILKSLKWREENQVDSILNTKTSLYFQENLRSWVEGEDKDGRPVLIMDIGHWHIRDILASGKADDIMNEFTKMIEKTMEAVREAGNLKGQNYPVTQFVIIADFHGFSYSQACSWGALTKFVAMTSIYEGHYPETIFEVYMINCPRALTWFLPIVKKAMSGTTVDKLREYGPNSNDWYPDLLRAIDPKYLTRLNGVPK